MPVFGCHPALAALFETYQAERFHHSFGCFCSQSGEALEFGKSGRTDPVEEAPRQFGVRLLVREFACGQGVRVPSSVAVALLVEASVYWYAADLARDLQFA